MKNKDKDKDKVKIPKEWETDEEKPVKPKRRRWSFHKPSRKIRVPGLRMFNRVLAGVLMVIFFFLSQITIAFTPIEGKVMGFLFLAVAYISAQYIWKTRRVTT